MTECQILLLPAPKKPPRRKLWRYFLLSFVSLSVLFFSGNIFFEYGFALEDEKVEEVHFSFSPLQVYGGVYSAFDDDFDRGFERIMIDSIPEIQLLPDVITRREAEKKIGVYVHMNNIANEKFLSQEITKIQKLPNSAIVFDVKGSLVYFDSDSEVAQKYGLVKSIYDLPIIVEELESAGIYTIARVISLKDPQFAIKNPSAWLKNPRTNEPVPEWVDPKNSEVLRYNYQIISEIVAAGVDEINLDFVRYPDKFTSNWLGISGEEKIENILNFVAMARRAIDSQKMGAVLSVDTFAILAWDFGKSEEALGQDIQKLSELTDIIAPMLYPATFSRDNSIYSIRNKSFEYSTIFLTLRKYQEILGENSKKLRPWIQGYHNSEKEIADQVSAVFDSGLCGFTVWDIQNDYSEVYKILSETELPEKCRN